MIQSNTLGRNLLLPCLIFTLLCTSGCGPLNSFFGPYLEALGINRGSAAYHRITEDYAHLDGMEIGASNLKSFYNYKIELAAFANVYKGEKFAKLAKLKLVKLNVKAEAYKIDLIHELENRQKDGLEAFDKYEKLAAPLEKKLRKHKASFLDRPALKKGDCFAEAFGSEFEIDDKRITNLRVGRIQTVGEKEVMVEDLFRARPDDSQEVMSEYGSKRVMAQFGKTDNEHKVLIERDYKVSCELGEKIAGAYREFLQSAQKIKPLKNQFAVVNSIVQELDD
jgi:hypothetical protein